MAEVVRKPFTVLDGSKLRGKPREGSTVYLSDDEAKKAVAGKAVEAVPAKPHRVLSNLRHGGFGYEPNSIVHLSANDAKSLIDLKVVEPAK